MVYVGLTVFRDLLFISAKVNVVNIGGD